MNLWILFKKINKSGIKYFLKNRFEDFYRKIFWELKPIWSINKFFINKKKIKIQKPIFFIGVQGAGLTIISRIIKRHPDIVYLSGNNDFWLGSDEMDGSFFVSDVLRVQQRRK